MYNFIMENTFSNKHIKKDIILEIINVSKPIKNKMLLENISFKLITKSFHVLIGRNGAGKSTLMNILTGNDKNYTGDIYFKNEDIKLVKIRKSCMYFNTNLSFPLWWNVFEYIKNFSYFFNNKVLSNKEIMDKLVEYNLEDKIKSNPNFLSSGEKKKLPIILVELLKPELVFLDEPDSNLDTEARKFIYEKLKNISEQGSSIFISSHYNDEIKQYANSVTYIEKGKILNSIIDSSNLDTKIISNVKNRRNK
ncbi:ABC transporter ATP-binding protein [Metamycoplasma hyosynoviae]|uniref:ATP-binding cassette domain-containing protein n=2 Tax=Metamycoplasma hyosynoviae TaxID=29559 RepID=UPI0023658E4A|nr:ABC transporter ATP-binding protein [Metamycoplasma hyosynoviae]MDD7847407.1 ABC transporter ATP-binding protein [Metamycoplasma hyosynoviae]